MDAATLAALAPSWGSDDRRLLDFATLVAAHDIAGTGTGYFRWVRKQQEIEREAERLTYADAAAIWNAAVDASVPEPMRPIFYWRVTT